MGLVIIEQVNEDRDMTKCDRAHSYETFINITAMFDHRIAEKKIWCLNICSGIRKLSLTSCQVVSMGAGRVH